MDLMILILNQCNDALIQQLLVRIFSASYVPGLFLDFSLCVHHKQIVSTFFCHSESVCLSTFDKDKT